MDTLELKHIPTTEWWVNSKWELTKDYHSPDGTVVPKGFLTDGVTVPFLFRFVLPSTGAAMGAAVVHDYLLTNTQGVEGRDYADGVFKRCLLLANISKLRVSIIYTVVHAFGILKHKAQRVKKWLS